MPGPQLSLKHFILKQRVLSFYRTAIRASRGDHSNFPLNPFLIFPVIPDAATRKETISWVRAEFERNKDIVDTVRPVTFRFSHLVYTLSPRTS